MFILIANKNQLAAQQREPITSGSVNVCSVSFQFSEDWEGLSRTAIFRAGTESWAVLLDESAEAIIPWEVLVRPGVKLFCGVYGMRGEQTVLPTIWADLGVIREGTSLGDEVRPPALELWEQELAGKGDNLNFDGRSLSLMSGTKPLSTVILDIGGETTIPGSGGSSDNMFQAELEAALSGKQDVLTVGDGIAIEEGTIRVTTPVKGVTQAEYDGIPQEERKGLYIITDANTALPEGGEVYSTEETRIGVWIDGKPIYRKTFVGVSQDHSSVVQFADITKLSVDTVVKISGVMESGLQSGIVELPCTRSDTNLGLIGVSPDKKALQLFVSSDSFYSRPFHCTLEYTKTTAQEVSA